MRGWRILATASMTALAVAVWPAGAGAATFSNTAPITIPATGTASPYPSAITVSGQTAPITDVNVTLKGYTHLTPSETDVVLVAPGGEALLLMLWCGPDPPAAAAGIDVEFDDSAPGPLPPVGNPFPSGSYRPTNYCGVGNLFPAPGPGAAYQNPGPAAGGTATLASTFNGTSANGTWSLFALDPGGPSAGDIADGWSLEISPDPIPAGGAAIPAGGSAAAGKDPKCNRLSKKRRAQERKLVRAGSERKRSVIGANIRDTGNRMTRLGC